MTHTHIQPPHHRSLVVREKKKKKHHLSIASDEKKKKRGCCLREFSKCRARVSRISPRKGFHISSPHFDVEHCCVLLRLLTIPRHYPQPPPLAMLSSCSSIERKKKRVVQLLLSYFSFLGWLCTTVNEPQ